MKQINKNLIVFILLIYSCGYIGAGSLGAYRIHVFPIVERKLSIAIDTLYLKFPKYKFPEKWKYEIDYWNHEGFKSSKSFFFYFGSGKEEMYFVTYLDAGFGTANPNDTRLAIRSVYSKNTGWKEIKKYDDNEKNRIEKRFEEEIILRIEKITNTKSSFEQTYP